MSSKKLITELQADALNAWTPLQQAALYQQHLAEQRVKDDEEWLREYREEEKKQAAKEKGEDVDEDKPHEVSAGKLADRLLNEYSPPLYAFLDIFGPPHLALVVFIGLHGLFWYLTPWYLHFLILYPIMYLIPLYMTLRSIWSVQDRAAWQCWWIVLSLVEYVELVLFRDGTRAMAWWPRVRP